MRLLITSIPGYGHLCPLLPLARAIRDSGHEVAVATSIGFQAELRRADIELFSSGPHWHESDFGGDEPNGPPINGFRRDLWNHLEFAVVPKMVQDVGMHVARWRPDVILSNDYEAAGRLVAEVQGIPFALASSGPRLPRSFRHQWQEPLFRSIRVKLDLSGDALDYSLRWLHLCFTPSTYFLGSGQGTEYAEAANEYGIKPTFADDLHAAGARISLSRRRTKPVVLCTFGTVFNKNTTLLRMVLLALHERVEQLIVLLGPGVATAALGDMPANVKVMAGESLSSLLPHVDYCVLHGGTATLMTTLAHGKSALLLPQGADQIINAIVYSQQRLGVVRMNAAEGNAALPGTAPPTTEAVVEGLLELIGNPIYAQNVRRFQEQLNLLPDLAAAVGLIEQLARTRAPVVRNNHR